MGQLVQYMSSSKVRVGGLLEVDADQVPLGDPIRVTMHLDDDTDTSSQTKSVKWSQGKKGQTQVLDLKRRSPKSSVFEGELTPKEKGIVHLWIKDKAHAQKVSVTGFSRELEANELNLAQLKQLSHDEKLLQWNEIEALAKTFSENQETREKQFTESLLDSQNGSNVAKTRIIWALLVVLTMLLGIEWFLRKRWHLL